MVRRILSALSMTVLCCTAACWAIVMTSKSETSYTTVKGTELVLKPDSTWDYKSDAGPRITSDLYEELGDGRIMNIRADNTWGFAEKSERTKVIMSGLNSVQANAVATNRDLGLAKKQVVQEVLDKFSRKINAQVYKGAKSAARLIDCIKLVGMTTVPAEKFLDDKKVWQVELEITMDRDQIISVAECVAEAEKAAKEQKEKGKTGAAAGAGN